MRKFIRMLLVTCSQAAQENAFSRILVGFHLRKAVETGTGHGGKIGTRVVNAVLRPVH